MEELFKDLKLFHQFSCWKMLQMQKLKLNSEEVQQVTQEIKETYDKDFSNIADIFANIAPVVNSSENYLTYIHKSVYEFFIAQSVIEETLAAKLEPLDFAKSNLT